MAWFNTDDWFPLVSLYYWSLLLVLILLMVRGWVLIGGWNIFQFVLLNPMLAVSLSLGSPSGFGSRGLEHAVAADAPPSSDPTNSSCNTQAGRDGSARLLMVTSGNFLVPLVIIQKSSS